MKKALLLTALIVVALAPMAMADPFTLTSGGPSVTTVYSGTGSFSTATASVTWSLSGDLLTVNITNTSTMANVSVTGLAFSITPNSTWSIVSQSGGISGWTSPGGAGGNGIMEVRNGNPGACGQPGALCNGQTGTIVFKINGLNGPLSIDSSSVHIQTNIGSIKPTGTTEVPEPASLFLMGTGLLGVGRIVRSRMRR